MVKGQKLLFSLKKKRLVKNDVSLTPRLIMSLLFCIILCDRLNLFLTDLGNHNVGTEVWIWLSGFLSTVYLNNLIAWKVILRAALSSYLLGERHCCRFSSNWKSLILISVRGACENMIKYRGIRHTVYWHSSMGSFCSSVIQPTLDARVTGLVFKHQGMTLFMSKKKSENSSTVKVKGDK